MFFYIINFKYKLKVYLTFNNYLCKLKKYLLTVIKRKIKKIKR
jgi:hypothetical protein